MFNNVVVVSWASAPGLCLVTYWYNGEQPSNRQEYNIHFYNNTIKTSSHNPLYISTDYGFLIGNIVWENNIFVSDTAYYLLYNRHYPSTTPASILLIRNNLFYRYSGAAHNQWSDGYNLSWGQNAIVDQNPLFTNGFHLQETSPAINQGTPVDLSFDYDDNPRPR